MCNVVMLVWGLLRLAPISPNVHTHVQGSHASVGLAQARSNQP